MKTLSLLISIFCICGSVFASPPPKSIEELKQLFLECVKAKDYEKMHSLSYWEGTPDFVVQSEEKHNKITFDQNLPIASCEITDIPEDFIKKMKQGFPYQGKNLAANLEPLKRLTINLGDAESKTSISKHIGKKDGVYYFLSSAFK
jgi:hypothetical protein